MKLLTKPKHLSPFLYFVCLILSSPRDLVRLWLFFLFLLNVSFAFTLLSVLCPFSSFYFFLPTSFFFSLLCDFAFLFQILHGSLPCWCLCVYTRKGLPLPALLSLASPSTLTIHFSLSVVCECRHLFCDVTVFIVNGMHLLLMR